MAQSGHPAVVWQCPLLGVKRTSRFQGLCGYRPWWIAIAATHVTAAAAINTKNGLSVDLTDFAMTIPRQIALGKSYS
jgi:hypothetical protein